MKLLTRADRILDGEQVREITAADREQIFKNQPSFS